MYFPQALQIGVFIFIFGPAIVFIILTIGMCLLFFIEFGFPIEKNTKAYENYEKCKTFIYKYKPPLFNVIRAMVLATPIWGFSFLIGSLSGELAVLFILTRHTSH